jgi:hypothetical protein
MFKQTRFPLLSLALLLALLAAATMPLSAFAQDEVPPPVEPSAVEVPPADEPVVADAPVVDAPPAEEITLPEVLEQLPEGADLVVLDEGGEALLLATQEAAEVVAAADPFFWDGTQYVGYSETGVCAAQVTVCNTSATPLQAAIDAFRDSSTATGSIYVAAGTYSADVYINGSNGNLKNLTGLIGEGSGATNLNGDLKLRYLNIGTNVFTFQGFTLTNGDLEALYNTATLNITDIQQSKGVYGIDVDFHTGDVNLTDVSATENSITNVYVGVTGNATIVDCEAGGGRYGIYVSEGTATLNNVNVHDNRYGVYGDDGSTVIAGLGCSTFANNTYGYSSVTFNDDAACGVKGQDKLPFPKVPQVEPPVEPPVVPPSSVTVLGNDNEIKNVFAPVYEQIIVVKTPFAADELPGELPTGKSFAAGAKIALMLGGKAIESAPQAVQVTFDIPDGMEPPFTVLIWNGSAWVEVPSQVVDGRVVFSVTGPGVYVLVTQ